MYIHVVAPKQAAARSLACRSGRSRMATGCGSRHRTPGSLQLSIPTWTPKNIPKGPCTSIVYAWATKAFLYTYLEPMYLLHKCLDGKEEPIRLFIMALGHCFTYFWGPGRAASI